MKNIAIFSLVFATLLLAGCLQGDAIEKASATPPDSMEKQQPDATSPTPGESMEKEIVSPTSPAASSEPTASAQPTVSQEPQGAMMEYSGTVLAGSSAKLLDFTQSDFEKAKASDSLIVLYFYADWCPICREEFPKMQQAFNELQDGNAVGFRVNYRDDFTDSDEEALAREHGVPYQHTKVFVKNGEQILKSPEGWDKQRYLDEIAKALAA